MMARAYGVKQVMNSRFTLLDFEGRWLHLMGRPEPVGSWLIWGESYQGKTTFALSLAKYLCRFGRVAYNSLEEGRCESVRSGFSQVDMGEVDGRLLLLDQEPMDELKGRLSKKKSPRFIVMDSLQYAGLSYEGYKELLGAFRHKLFIWVSHAEGKHPTGQVAMKVRYDAFVKIRVEGFMAFAKSRYGSTEQPYVIWREGADRYYGQKL